MKVLLKVNDSLIKQMSLDLLHLMDDGKTIAQVAAQFRLSERKLMSMINDPDNLELKDAYEVGVTAMKAKYEEMLIAVAKGEMPRAREQSLFKLLQRYCQYEDKKEINNTYKFEGSEKDLDEHIERYTKKLTVVQNG